MELPQRVADEVDWADLQRHRQRRRRRDARTRTRRVEEGLAARAVRTEPRAVASGSQFQSVAPLYILNPLATARGSVRALDARAHGYGGFMLQTEYAFTLPKGYVDGEGTLHREGVMRLATAFDEITPLKDPRVHNNPAYLLVILLARVVTRLGALEQVNPKIIEGLYAADLAYLQ